MQYYLLPELTSLSFLSHFSMDETLKEETYDGIDQPVYERYTSFTVRLLLLRLLINSAIIFSFYHPLWTLFAI